ncbi:hypothetical protein WICMUC_001517 [Wickerhamomyces mucosus]|uniref:chitinase n=1 Tax=Wickerhamomyces mucosus TaxID=1378264 RepID=A0A9P8TH65_9ASCO|nr:hypothetical protein WICMUC_001517 [Wickerhamomyces mucosus]
MLFSSLALSMILFFSQFVLSKFHNNRSIAVYWGQETSNEPQKSLEYYCQSKSVDIVILAFISQFGEHYISDINQAINNDDSDDYESQKQSISNNNNETSSQFILNLSSYCLYSNVTNSFKCPSLVEDIKTCQARGKKVLLSLGGEYKSGSIKTYGFANDLEGENFAKTLWDSFGEGESVKSLQNDYRPFGDSIIDGFDIDIENEDQTGYLSMVKELSNLSEKYGSKKYYFSSAPQCIFPDKSNSLIIDNFQLDFIFVQFYNNDCQLTKNELKQKKNNDHDHDGDEDIGNEKFNYETWLKHIVENLNFTNTKIFIGLPSSSKAASNGFIKDESILSKIIGQIEKNEIYEKYFGGLMFWDASKGFDLNDRDSIDDSYIYKVWSKLIETNSEFIDEESGVSISNDSSTDSNPATSLFNNTLSSINFAVGYNNYYQTNSWISNIGLGLILFLIHIL